MIPQSRISYFGSDPDFIQELRKFLSHPHHPGELECYPDTKGMLIRTCVKDRPGVVIIDVTDSTSNQEILEEVLFIKRNQPYRGILFVALFPDIDALERAKNYFTAGFNLFFVKGCESESLFRDCLYIAYEITGSFPAYAKAGKIDHSVMAQVHSTVRSISESSFILETDLELSQEDIQFTLPLFPDLRAKSFMVKGPLKPKPFFTMLNSYEVELPLANAWGGEDPELTLLPDTLETWNSLHQGFLKHEPLNIAVISDNEFLFEEIFQSVDHEKVRIHFYPSFSQEVTTIYDLIFYDIEILPDESSGLDDLNNLTLMAQSQTERPIIISTKNPSTTEATQKLLHYPSIVCATGPLTAPVLHKMSSNYFTKRKSDLPENYLFPLDSSERVVEIPQKVFITTLTEHEITFYGPAELPMFTLLQFQLPFKFSVILVPSLMRLPMREESTHYMGFVTAVDEKGLETLRKFINSIISQPLTDYGPEAMETYLKSLLPQVIQEVVQTPLAETPAQRTEVSEAPTIKRTFKGNSKL